VSAPLDSLVGVVVELVDRLEAAGIDYALGGAIAYSAWAEPRATRDIDLNLWVEPAQLQAAFDLLAAAGVAVDRGAATREIDERGMFIGYHGDYRVDVFVPSVPFYETARARRQRVDLAGRQTWVLSPETLAVFKMLFFRPKDLADIGRMLVIQRGRFDSAFVRAWLITMLGETDERISAWDRLVNEAAKQ
jgi:hypothetical protein